MERWALVICTTLMSASAVPQSNGVEAAAAAIVTPDAPARVNVDQPPSLHERRDLWQADDGLFYTEALVNGTPIRFIVDTGASVVVLTESDAATAQLAADGSEGMRVATAGGTASMRRVKVREIKIAGSAVTGVDAAVVGGDLKVSLLGQNVLSRLNSVTITGGRLRLN